MKTAFAILNHALRMLTVDMAQTFRALLPALTLVLGCSAAIGYLFPDISATLNPDPGHLTEQWSQDMTRLVLLGAVAMLGYAWMAVIWHRYVLLNGAEQRERLQPSLPVFLKYIWRALIVGFAQLLLAAPVALLISFLAAATFKESPSTVVAIGLSMIGTIISVWIALRFSLVLPAAAMGRSLALYTSWTATKSIARPLWTLAALLTVIYLITAEISVLLLPETGLILALGQTIILLAEGIVFISVLTTLYGKLIEGRSLAA